MRDGQGTLRACLESLSAQTFADHEVVAVDDGSSDGTAAILGAAAAADPRVRVVRTPSRGLVAALNTALAHARGAFLARMDADDVSHFGKRPEVLLEWRDHRGRLTRRDPRYAEERFRDLKLEALERGALRAGRGVVVWGAGPVGKGWARALLGRGHAVAAFVEVDRRKIGQRIHGSRVVDVAGAAAFAAELHLAAVGRPGARARIRAAARAQGRREGEDLIAVA